LVHGVISLALNNDQNSTILQMDPSRENELVIAGVKITITKVSAYSITYTLENLNK